MILFLKLSYHILNEHIIHFEMFSSHNSCINTMNLYNVGLALWMNKELVVVLQLYEKAEQMSLSHNAIIVQEQSPPSKQVFCSTSVNSTQQDVPPEKFQIKMFDSISVAVQIYL